MEPTFVLENDQNKQNILDNKSNEENKICNRIEDCWGMCGVFWGITLNGLTKEGPFEEIVEVGWESERGEVNYCKNLGKSLLGRGKRKHKGHEVGTHDRRGTGAIILTAK